MTRPMTVEQDEPRMPGGGETDDPVDYTELAIEILGHWPGPLDAQQQHDLLVEARARGLL